MDIEPVAVIDFETTGLSPAMGDRATEIAVVVVRDGRIEDRFQSLMNAGVRIPTHIQMLTGISNQMVAEAPPAEEVMKAAAKVVGRCPLVAHNASFDRRFWDAELSRIGGRRQSEFACSMLLARRFYPQLPNHRLGEVVTALNLPRNGKTHRAMVDAEMAAHLWMRLHLDLRARFKCRPATHAQLVQLQSVPAAKIMQRVASWQQGSDIERHANPLQHD